MAFEGKAARRASSLAAELASERRLLAARHRPKALRSAALSPTPAAAARRAAARRQRAHAIASADGRTAATVARPTASIASNERTAASRHAVRTSRSHVSSASIIQWRTSWRRALQRGRSHGARRSTLASDGGAESRGDGSVDAIVEPVVVVDGANTEKGPSRGDGARPPKWWSVCGPAFSLAAYGLISFVFFIAAPVAATVGRRPGPAAVETIRTMAAELRDPRELTAAIFDGVRP